MNSGIGASITTTSEITTFVSLKGDTVKSFEECEIANFLYIHGVPYEYEAPYEHDTATREHRQYKPDFYLPGPGIYIEHFGIDANGNPAPFVDREKYLSGIEWKRELHREKGTILVETYSHERASDCLIRNLRAKLEKHGGDILRHPQEPVLFVTGETGTN